MFFFFLLEIVVIFAWNEKSSLFVDIRWLTRNMLQVKYVDYSVQFEFS